tara:strand:- start:2450 stop:3463 length:1014 start_codon:yes stop_codon:yes gene_type:complete
MENPSIKTIFFGGGTPSLLNQNQTTQLLKTIENNADIDPAAEITLESNPDDLTLEKCEQFIASGINRLSIGIQSLQNNLLTILNRRHSNVQALQAINNGKNAGFTNISGDLMYGLPSQTYLDWEMTLKELLSAAPTHISMYSLTIEEGTPFHKMFHSGSITLPPDDEIADMYALAQEQLNVHGYQQYEISNWCIPKYQSIHNLTYWRRKPYIGIGPGAHSNLGNVRYWNIKSPAKYIQNISSSDSLTSHIIDNPIIDDYEILTDQQIASELMFLGLRLSEGIDCDIYYQEHGLNLLEIFKNEIKKLTEENLIEISNNIIKLSPSKIFIANRIFEEFI